MWHFVKYLLKVSIYSFNLSATLQTFSLLYCNCNTVDHPLNVYSGQKNELAKTILAV